MKKLLISICLACTVSTSLQAQKWNQTYQNYIDQYKDVAIEEMKRYHIPASITLAQGLFESSAGRSELVTKGNNHFGIKCHGWTGATIYHDDDAKGECFRAYNNALESYDDHSKFLIGNQRYASLFELSETDYVGWANGLKACGYATNPAYAQKLISIIELYNLQQYDTQKKNDPFIVKHTGNSRPIERYQKPTGLHPIAIFNKNYYLIAREGDTFKSIGEEVEISWRKLAMYNERDGHDRLHAGDIIFLKPKRSKAPKSFKGRPHIVKPGESMYIISQKYGIKLKNLYKMNKLTPDYQIRVGDQIKVR